MSRANALLIIICLMQLSYLLFFRTNCRIVSVKNANVPYKAICNVDNDIFYFIRK